MEIRFVVTKDERKALAKAVGEIVGCAPVYMGTPSFAFAVHNYTIDRQGTITYDERVDARDAQYLLAELASRGFVYEAIADAVPDADSASVPELSETSPDDCGQCGPHCADAMASDEVSGVDIPDRLAVEASESGIPDKLVIEVPFEGFTTTALNNLDRLVSGKAALIMKAIGADALPIERKEGSLCFPWFAMSAAEAESDAYARFVHALCDMAKKQQRVTLKEKALDGDTSEKFEFRCFLLRLGFIGKEYAAARKVLLSKLSGNGSFKNGDHKSRGVSVGADDNDIGDISDTGNTLLESEAAAYE